MTELVTEGEVEFQHGSPGFAYTKVYRCFPGNGNGLLFRLVNDKKQWAFYNDTEEMIFRVTAKLGKESSIKPLGRATMDPPADDDDKWGHRVSVAIGPGRTERFLEGTVEGFEVDFSSEAVPADHVAFECGAPTVAYDAIYPCLKGHGNGLLFRLVANNAASGESTWSYHNDTREFAMEVEVTFADKTCVKPLGKTRVENAPDNADGAVYKITVDPVCTEPFLRGYPRDYSQSFVANPVNNEKSLESDDINFENGEPDKKIISYPCTKVFKAFKNKGNGLMFLLIDDEKKKWAFYNDTTDYNITATVRFGPESTFETGGNTKVSNDPDVDGGTVCVITVPPLTTELFITHGNPKNYQLSFAAEGVTRSLPEENPNYENGEPDRAVIPHYNKVFKCFKDHGNGLLFRLVDEKRGMWAFYNDTKDVMFTVKVKFEESFVQALGKTKKEEDDDLGTVHVLQVPPLTTEVFAEGDLGSFTTKFSGKKYRPA